MEQVKITNERTKEDLELQKVDYVKKIGKQNTTIENLKDKISEERKNFSNSNCNHSATFIAQQLDHSMSHQPLHFG